MADLIAIGYDDETTGTGGCLPTPHRFHMCAPVSTPARVIATGRS